MRTRLVATLVLIGVAAVSGCSSKSSSGTGAPASSSGTAAKPTGSEIAIGIIGGFGGSAASSTGAAPDVLKAWAQQTNDNGGIKGHPIKVVVKDLGDNIAGGPAAVKELVEQDHVVAIVGEQDTGDSTWAAYVTGKGVPVIGGLSSGFTMTSSSDFFPAGTQLVPLTYGTLAEAKKVGTKFGVLYCAESPLCAQAPAFYKAIGQAAGVTVPVTAKIASSSPDFTGVCQQLKNGGVQSYLVGINAVTAAHVVDACVDAGLKATNVASDGSASAAWVHDPKLEGSIAVETNVAFTDTATEGGKAYQALLAKYLPNLGDRNGPNAQYSFVAGQLFAAAANAGSGADITSASLLEGLYTLKGETLGGLAPPLTFSKGKPAIINCYFTMTITDSAWQENDGGTPTCAPDALVSGITSAMLKQVG